jgi:methionyl-tRNA formyltransferase
MSPYPFILFSSPPFGIPAEAALLRAGYQPLYTIRDTSLSTEDICALIVEYQPTFLLVIGYGAILKQPVLDSVAGQVLNIHPSLLPLYRGPSPVVSAILDGAEETGVTLIELDAKMDHGDILGQARLPLQGNETPEQLYASLAQKGVDLLLTHGTDYLEDRATLLPQNHGEATFTHFINKQDGLLNALDTPDCIERKIRAYQHWPWVHAYIHGKRLIIRKAHILAGVLILDEVQPESGKPMTLAQYSAGKRCKPEAVYTDLGLPVPNVTK